MLPRVVWYKLADVSEVLTIFIIKVAGSKHLWNVGLYGATYHNTQILAALGTLDLTI
jgi:hypothetical protein